jgi:hypothetical protein
MLTSNLPIANELGKELDNYEELIVFAAKAFRISNLTDIGLPPWEKTLLGM